MSGEVPETIFRVKPETDPFHVYGGLRAAQGEEGHDQFDEISAGDDSMKVFLQEAVMSQREKFFAELDSATEIGRDFDEIMQLERGEYYHEEESESSHRALKNEDSKTVTVAKRPPPPPQSSSSKFFKPGMKTAEKITMALSQLDATFSQIFQALLVVIDNPSAAGQVTICVGVGNHAEIERATKRSREFEVRLKRLAFELKQKVCQLRAAAIKVELHPSKTQLRAVAETKLYQALRCVHCLLKAYLSHLPHAGSNIYPEPLRPASVELEAVASLTEKLNFDPREFASDVQRLRMAAEKSGRTVVEDGDKNVKDADSASDIMMVNADKKTLNMINNLAREKFGPAGPKSPKKTNLKRQQKQSLPKGNKLLEESLALERAKRSAPTPKGLPFKVTNNSNSPTMVHHAAQTVSHPAPNPPPSVFVLDLADEELSHILAYSKPGTTRLSHSRRGAASSGHPVKFADDFSTEIVDEIVANVCREMFLDDVVEKILRIELRKS